MEVFAVSLLTFYAALTSCNNQESSIILDQQLAQTIKEACGAQSEMHLAAQKKLRSSALTPSMVANLFPIWPESSWGIGSISLMGVKDMLRYDRNEKPSKLGYFVIGSCGNGDDIALKIKENGPWAVYYLGHEYMLPDGPDEGWAVKVTDSLEEFLKKGWDEDFSYDHYQAKEALNSQN